MSKDNLHPFQTLYLDPLITILDKISLLSKLDVQISYHILKEFKILELHTSVIIISLSSTRV